MLPLMANAGDSPPPAAGCSAEPLPWSALPALLGPILGPLLGRLILTGLDWRWLFWVNVPFCVVGWLLAWRCLPADRPEGGPALDVGGLLLLSPGIAGLIVGLSNIAGNGGFGQLDVLAPLAAGVLLVGAFVGRRPATADDRARRRRAAAPACGRQLVDRVVPVGDSRCTARCCCCRCSGSRSGTDALTAA